MQAETQPKFLKRLAILASRHPNMSRTRQVANAYFDRAGAPVSEADWMLVVLLAVNPTDRAFGYLLAKANEPAASRLRILARSKGREVLANTILGGPDVDQTAHNWTLVEGQLSAAYGVLGAEATNGAAMAWAARKGDWTAFGTFFVRYFRTAQEPNPHLLNNLTHRVLVNVDDAAVLDRAAELQRTIAMQLDASPVVIDTYARLLSKLGRKEEALRFQAEAVRRNTGEADPGEEIERNLIRMQSGLAMW